ncbi:MAG: general secretion pathway protein GspK, partial [Deltaproteobacteria bacterium]|nr:general secretion pathway protein GspK [Deltaproteobacteria bacterium]
MRAPFQQARRRRRQERGVALLIAVISIAVLTALAVDFAYTTRVDLQLAANGRDEVRAYYLARSAIGLSRLLMRFQKQIDSAPLGGLNLGSLASNPAVAPLLQQAGVSPQDLSQLAGGGGMPGMGGGMAIQLWKMARVDCQMLQGMVNSDPGDGPKSGSTRSGKFAFDDEFPEKAGEMKSISFGGFQGCFLAQIQDEEEKLNLNKLDSGALAGMAIVPRFLDLFGDKRFEFLYEREDANGTKITAPETLIALHDWMDADNVASALNLNGQAGQDPFQPGFSDENSPYDRYEPRYKAKNAPFDTLDEAYFVVGVHDRFMAAFRDRLTVYPDINSRLNVNTDDPLMLYVAILSVADPLRPDPRLRDPL